MAAAVKKTKKPTRGPDLEPHQVVLKPLITEKGTHQSTHEHHNAYSFEVNLWANKAQIKHAVQELFNVRVLAVRTQLRLGKRRRYRIIDFKRRKDNVWATVVSIEYDPNRSARIALLKYEDGEKDVTLLDTTVLIGTAGLDPNVYKSARNIEGVKVLPAAEFNCYTVLKQKRLVLTRSALEALRNPPKAADEKKEEPKA